MLLMIVIITLIVIINIIIIAVIIIIITRRRHRLVLGHPRVVQPPPALDMQQACPHARLQPPIHNRIRLCRTLHTAAAAARFPITATAIITIPCATFTASS